MFTFILLVLLLTLVCFCSGWTVECMTSSATRVDNTRSHLRKNGFVDVLPMSSPSSSGNVQAFVAIRVDGTQETIDVHFNGNSVTRFVRRTPVPTPAMHTHPMALSRPTINIL